MNTDHEVVLMAMRRDVLDATLQMCLEWKQLIDPEAVCVEHDEAIELLEKAVNAPQAEVDP